MMTKTRETNEHESAILSLVLSDDSLLAAARKQIDERLEKLRAAATARRNPFNGEKQPLDQAVLHLVPIRNPFGRSWGYNKDDVIDHLTKIHPFGHPERFDLRYKNDGVYSGSMDRHVAFLRDGSIEFQMYDIVRMERAYTPPRPIIASWKIGEAIQGAFDDATTLAEEGFLSPPLLVRFHLLQVKGAELLKTPHFGSLIDRPLESEEVSTEEFLLTDWTAAPEIMREILDRLWQTWGYVKCTTIDERGRHVSPVTSR
jgi:hypothetical protein